jgi:hypothetical protein
VKAAGAYPVRAVGAVARAVVPPQTERRGRVTRRAPAPAQLPLKTFDSISNLLRRSLETQRVH